VIACKTNKSICQGIVRNINNKKTKAVLSMKFHDCFNLRVYSETLFECLICVFPHATSSKILSTNVKTNTFVELFYLAYHHHPVRWSHMIG